MLRIQICPLINPNSVCVCAPAHTQSCLFTTLDCSPPGSSVHGILQARILEWLPLPTPGDLSNPGIEPTSLASPALTGRFLTTEPPEKPQSLRLDKHKILR